jgi:hypothetical protein
MCVVDWVLSARSPCIIDNFCEGETRDIVFSVYIKK